MDEKSLRSELNDLKQKEAKLRAGLAGKNAQAEQEKASSPALRYTWLGAEFAAIFIGSTYAGYHLDQRMQTKPWLLLLGIAAGFGLALYRLIFVARRLGE